MNEAAVVLGVVDTNQRVYGSGDSLADAMDPAPTTLRPTLSIGEAAAFLNRHELPGILITTTEGKLVRILDR